MINSRQCYLPRIRPPPFLLLPPPVPSHLSAADRIVRRRVSRLEGCQRGLACALDAGKCRHTFTFPALLWEVVVEGGGWGVWVGVKTKRGWLTAVLNTAYLAYAGVHMLLVECRNVQTCWVSFFFLFRSENLSHIPRVQTLTSLIKDTLPLFILPRLRHLWLLSHKAFVFSAA